ncbi:GNAT family N-acetyltransferase [Methanobrevibacter sp.]|uniref:GNAT family N-acetyltransferase n=1 Tax=Methanobrevibacter sp. TaxID=66852 RepID=UPI0038909A4E
MIIRLEEEKDYLEVENMVRNSFWNIYRPGAFEHYIVHNLRDDESFIKDLAYVIEVDDKIIAHINYSKGRIVFKNDAVDAVVLGPISVDTKYQNHGYGSKLIEHTLGLILEMNIPFVFVIGDEHYYHRFGFESASKYDIYLDGTDKNEECPFFMIKILDKNKMELIEGTFYNPEVFNVNENDVDEFDKQFEFKEKLVLEGQL